jgi:hypothetical protein
VTRKPHPCFVVKSMDKYKGWLLGVRGRANAERTSETRESVSGEPIVLARDPESSCCVCVCVCVCVSGETKRALR